MTQLQYINIKDLKPYSRNARTHSAKQVQQIARSIKEFGFTNPILVDKDNQIIAGHGRMLAGLQLGLTEVPVIYLDHLTEAQKRAYIIADNKLAEKAGWDESILKIELQNLIEIESDFDITLTGFETPEVDLIIHNTVQESDPLDTLPDEIKVPAQVQLGDLWQLGDHLLYCGDALKEESFEILLNKDKARLVFIDPPFNVKINGHVCKKGKTAHKEFVMASGEMSSEEFTEFLRTTFKNLVHYSVDGAINFVCMDWSHTEEILSASKRIYKELKNICVWEKGTGGMGSLYRSQHELVFVFKNGDAPHINNIELGKHGRYRTNVWSYPRPQIMERQDEAFKLHCTVKPTRMIADAIMDCSHPGDLVLDCFGGSGSTLLAAEQTHRKVRLIELDPHYCDVALYRFEKMKMKKAILIGNYKKKE